MTALFQVLALNMILELLSVVAANATNGNLVAPAVSLASTFSTLDNLYSLQVSTPIDAGMSTWMWCTAEET